MTIFEFDFSGLERVERAIRAQGGVGRKTRQRVIKRDGGRCTKCLSRRHLQVHHIEPRSQGGSNKPSNLITLCRDCHRAEHECQVPT